MARSKAPTAGLRTQSGPPINHFVFLPNPARALILKANRAYVTDTIAIVGMKVKTEAMAYTTDTSRETYQRGAKNHREEVTNRCGKEMSSVI